jgi:hypothetical protein
MSFRLIPLSSSAEKRHDHRFERPLTLVIDGAPIESRDWGFGGFKVDGPTDLQLSVDEEFVISHIMDLQGEPQVVFAIGRVVWVDPTTGDFGASFAHLGERAFDLLEKAMFHRKARGDSQSLKATIA